MKSAQLLVGALFDDFTPKRSFSCENGIQSRKWKDKIKKSILHPFRRWWLDTTEPIGPTSDVGSAHNFGRGENTSCSCLCQSRSSYRHARCTSGQFVAPCVYHLCAATFSCPLVSAAWMSITSVGSSSTAGYGPYGIALGNRLGALITSFKPPLIFHGKVSRTAVCG